MTVEFRAVLRPIANAIVRLAPPTAFSIGFAASPLNAHAQRPLQSSYVNPSCVGIKAS